MPADALLVEFVPILPMWERLYSSGRDFSATLATKLTQNNPRCLPCWEVVDLRHCEEQYGWR